MPDYRFRPDLPFLNKKIELGFRAQGRGSRRGEEHSTNAQITNAGNVISAPTVPIHPNVVAAGIDTSSHPSGIGWLCQCGCHDSPRCLWARAAEKTNDPRPSIANNSWQIGSEQSGEDLNCCPSDYWKFGN